MIIRNSPRVAVVMAMLAMGGMVSCGAAETSASSAPSSVPTWEAYRDRAARVVDGKTIYVVEWDLAVTEEELRQRYLASFGDGVGSQGQELIVNRVGSVDDVWTGNTQLNLTYCVSNDFGTAKARAVSEMEQATRAWEAVANVEFRYLPAHDGNCSNANSAVVFSVRPWANGGACAFFPSGGGCVARTLVMNFTDLDNNYGTISPNVRTVGVFRHELGHILGLRHEHTRPNSGVCFEDSSWRAVTAYDQSSVMHYPWCNGSVSSDLSITSLDAEGIRLLYGRSHAETDHRFLAGDVNGDGRGDMLQAWRGWTSIPTCQYTSASNYSCSNPGATLYNWGAPEQEFLTGDFNGDGRTDTIQAYRKWTSIPTCFSTGSGWSCGNFSATVHQHADDTNEQKFMTGRFNNDNRTDVIQVYRKWSNLPLCTSTGAGWSCSNPAATLYNSGSAEQQFLTGDMNGDGYTDVMQAYRGWGSLPTCFASGAGTWSCSVLGAAIYDSGSYEQRFLTGDFNGDGRTDVIQTYRGWSSIPLCLSTGSGWSCSNPGATIVNSGSFEQQFLTGDFNGDGRTDVVQAHRGWNTLPLCLSTGSGWSCSSPPATIYNSGSREQRFIATDVNGDGRTDIVQAHRAWGTYPVCLSTGSGWSCSNQPAAIYNPGVE